MCQSIARGILATKDVGEVRQKLQVISCTSIQKRWRLYMTEKQFKRTKRNVVYLQSAIQRWLILRHLKKEIMAATIIAKYVRKHQSQIRYQQSRFGILLIQTFGRRKAAEKYLILCRRSATKIQSTARRKLASDQVTKLAQERLIESQWKVYLVEKNLIELRPHVTFIKGIADAWLALQHKASTKISSTWRSYSLADEYKRTLKGRHKKHTVCFIIF